MSTPRAKKNPWTQEEEEDLIYKLAALIDVYSLQVKRTPGAIATKINKVLDGTAVHKAVKEIRINQKYYS